jgi:hypothetical protein
MVDLFSFVKGYDVLMSNLKKKLVTVTKEGNSDISYAIQTFHML